MCVKGKSSAEIKCKEGNIVIEDVRYGRRRHNACDSADFLSSRGLGAWNKISEKCNGTRRCIVDPFWDWVHRIEDQQSYIRYRCVG